MIPGARSLALTAVLIANAFPGSCSNEASHIDISVDDCSCLPSTVTVTVEGSLSRTIELRCGETPRVDVDDVGYRLVTVQQGNRVVYEETHLFESGEEIDIELTCRAGSVRGPAGRG